MTERRLIRRSYRTIGPSSIGRATATIAALVHGGDSGKVYAVSREGSASRIQDVFDVPKAEAELQAKAGGVQDRSAAVCLLRRTARKQSD